MRTKEDQAKSLRDSLCADYVGERVHEAGYELAMCHIEEAERRAEQRVRAELSTQIEQQEETIKALQDDLSAALTQIEELTL